MLFGVAAACIPTLRPLYKWPISEYSRLASRSKQTKPPTDSCSASKPPRTTLPTNYGKKIDTNPLQEEDLLPLQNFERAGESGNSERKIK